MIKSIKNRYKNQQIPNSLAVLSFTLLFVLFVSGTAFGQNQYNPKSGSAVYQAEIEELNPDLTNDEVEGFATFIVENGRLNITVAVKGLAPSMMHLQHFHGFKASMKEAECPESEADTNGDSIVDLIETHPSTGVTLVPFNGAPAELTIKSTSYPVANKNGLLTYQMSVSLESLKSAIQNKYDIDELSLANRVVYIHGVPKNSSLPQSVQSLPGVPAHVTVPVACGEIEAL